MEVSNLYCPPHRTGVSSTMSTNFIPGSCFLGPVEHGMVFYYTRLKYIPWIRLLIHLVPKVWPWAMQYPGFRPAGELNAQGYWRPDSCVHVMLFVTEQDHAVPLWVEMYCWIAAMTKLGICTLFKLPSPLKSQFLFRKTCRETRLELGTDCIAVEGR